MKKELGKIWLSLAAPALICLGLVGFFSRKGSDRVQALPALLIGIGLTSSSAIARNIRRKELLRKIRYFNNDVN